MLFGPVDELEAFGFGGQILALERVPDILGAELAARLVGERLDDVAEARLHFLGQFQALVLFEHPGDASLARLAVDADHRFVAAAEVGGRSEEHTSELQSLMRISYAVFCLKKKKNY